MATIPSEGSRALLLNISLVTDDLTPEQAEALRRHTQTSDGVIGRQLLVPEMMKLHSLHYAIQAAFGWQNAHPHRFELPEKDFNHMTNGLFREWRDLVGVYFRVPDAPPESYYANETIQQNQSFDAWLRNRYSGPYAWDIGAFFEHLVTARLFLQARIEEEEEKVRQAREPDEDAEDDSTAYTAQTPEGMYGALPDDESLEQYAEDLLRYEEEPQGPDWDAMTTEEAAALFQGGMRDIIERVRVGQIICPPEAPKVTTRQLDRIAGKAEIASAVGQHMTYPITVEISDHEQDYELGKMPLDVLELQDTYERVLSETDLSTIPASSSIDYYYGTNENWHVKIECIEVYSLVGYQPETLPTDEYPVVDHTGAEIMEEAQDIVSNVILDNRPLCTGVLGPNVFENVEGLGAFADFLSAYNSSQRDQQARARRRAVQQDWSPDPPEPLRVL